uniref:Uncharacterized protein n=1 Tax=Nelumbo nucifera TaxID=4432 RepID=A0A822YIA8_NELNU|nr:TPA_asm: hypothetical protein HUJ06_009566 [Nelumbo nucifera]
MGLKRSSQQPSVTMWLDTLFKEMGSKIFEIIKVTQKQIKTKKEENKTSTKLFFFFHLKEVTWAGIQWLRRLLSESC